MEIFYLIMFIQCVTMIFQSIVSYILVFHYNLGIKGLSLTTCITFWLNLILTTAYITFKKGIVNKETWFFFNKQCFSGWYLYCRYGVPATLMLYLEWWTFEVLWIFSRLLGVDQLSAQVVFLNFTFSSSRSHLGLDLSVQEWLEIVWVRKCQIKQDDI